MVSFIGLPLDFKRRCFTFAWLAFEIGYLVDVDFGFSFGDI
jgi:hypothetical protein